jgi:hypothetical protein
MELNRNKAELNFRDSCEITSTKQKYFFSSYHVSGLEMYMEAVFGKNILTVASHLVMCIWHTLTVVDAPLFSSFD